MCKTLILMYLHVYSIVPACLQDPSLGDHHYVTTKSGHKFHYVAKGDTEKPLMLCMHGFPDVSIYSICFK